MLNKFKEFYNTYKLYKIMKYVKITLVILFILFEEIAWNRIGKPAYIKVKSLKIMNRFHLWISDFENRYILLVIFLMPFLLMELLSLIALKALATGAIVMGIGLYTIKILLTAPVVIIFNAAKKQLTSFYPIRYGYGSILQFKRSTTFRNVKHYISAIKAEIILFKNDYLDGDESNLFDELKKLYQEIKKI